MLRTIGIRTSYVLHGHKTNIVHFKDVTDLNFGFCQCSVIVRRKFNEQIAVAFPKIYSNYT